MEKKYQKVDWHAYAEKYDMLLEYNPFYQQLRREIFATVKEWTFEDEACILDIGAGTGNYSVLLAGHFPNAKVIHLDNNPAMNGRAVLKKREKNLVNLDIMDRGIEEVDFPENSMAALVSVHALYTFPDPDRVLRHMHSWLKPGGKGILVDPGRIVNVWNWQLAIGLRLFGKYGISKTLKIFRDAKPVSRQNRHIRNMQRKGELWTHSPEEFQRAVAQAGFIILDARTCFRGLSDRVVVTKV